MFTKTNSLVANNGFRRFALPVTFAAVMAVGSATFLHGNRVHASAITASALDDRSVSSLTALDHDMESAGRSCDARRRQRCCHKPWWRRRRGWSGAAAKINPQDIPPQLRQFFGFGGGNGAGGRLLPQQHALSVAVSARVSSSRRTDTS